MHKRINKHLSTQSICNSRHLSVDTRLTSVSGFLILRRPPSHHTPQSTCSHGACPPAQPYLLRKGSSRPFISDCREAMAKRVYGACPYKKYQIGTAGGWLDPSDPTVSEAKLGSESKTRPRPSHPCPYTLLPALYRKPRPYFFALRRLFCTLVSPF